MLFKIPHNKLKVLYLGSSSCCYCHTCGHTLGVLTIIVSMSEQLFENHYIYEELFQNVSWMLRKNNVLDNYDLSYNSKNLGLIDCSSCGCDSSYRWCHTYVRIVHLNIDILSLNPKI